MRGIVERLNENIISDAFERRAIVDGALCERLIRERKEAAEEITRLRAENEKLRAALKPFKEIHDKCLAAFPDIEDADELHFSVADFAHLRAAAAAIRESEAKP